MSNLDSLIIRPMSLGGEYIYRDRQLYITSRLPLLNATRYIKSCFCVPRRLIEKLQVTWGSRLPVAWRFSQMNTGPL